MAGPLRISYTYSAMPREMSKTERVAAALQGREVDRPPVSAWWHDYQREWSAAALCEATVEAFRKYDWDFIKVNPRFCYYAEGWGAVYQRYDDRMPEIVEKPVQSPDDLAKIIPLDPASGAWGEQLEALRLIGRAVAAEAFFLQTVFSPLAVVTRITGSTKFTRKLMREAPAALEQALLAIEQTLTGYVSACLDAGASGIFYAAVEWGSADNISWADYERFGKPYDLRILVAARNAVFNVLHVCRENNHLLRVLDYPVHAFNWDVGGRGNPTLTEVLSKTDRAVMGGVRTETMRAGEYGDVLREAEAAKEETRGLRWLRTPGCSIDPETPEANLFALTGAVRR